MEVKNTRLLFLYRSILFNKTIFTTNNKELKTIVKALNIKEKKQRNEYVYDEAIKEINKYYDKNLCDFVNDQCIAQRKEKSDEVNGCCKRCPIVTNKGCPSANLSCKLIYCKTALKNKKKIKMKDIKILRCISLVKRIIIKADFFIPREEILEDMNGELIRWLIRDIKRKLKNGDLND